MISPNCQLFVVVEFDGRLGNEAEWQGRGKEGGREGGKEGVVHGGRTDSKREEGRGGGTMAGGRE